MHFTIVLQSKTSRFSLSSDIQSISFMKDSIQNIIYNDIYTHMPKNKCIFLFILDLPAICNLMRYGLTTELSTKLHQNNTKPRS